MKKNIIKLITVFFVSMLFVFGVDALSRPVNDAARVPSRIPEPGSKLYATVQDVFDFSKIKFKNGNEEISGYDSMRKIVFSEGFEFDDQNGVFGVKDDWFTAYCLDGRLKYPENGFYFSQITGNTDVDSVVEDMIKTALLNQSNSSQAMYDLLKQARGSLGLEVLYKKPQKRPLPFASLGFCRRSRRVLMRASSLAPIPLTPRRVTPFLLLTTESDKHKKHSGNIC